MRPVEAGEADVVIVGYGGAGAAAAITAARAGASVAIVEKQSRDTHFTNTRMSGGLFMGVNDAETATVYLDQCAGGMIPHDVNAAWAERALTLPDWCRSVGIEVVKMAGAWFPQFEGSEAIDVFAPLPPGTARPDQVALPSAGTLTDRSTTTFGNGETLHRVLLQATEAERGVAVSFERPASGLLVEDGRVSGVECDAGGETVRYRARRGVILACGGYEQDEDLLLNTMKAFPVYFYGTPFNTGDGVRMAQSVGADLWHMNQMIGRAVAHFAVDERTEWTFNISLSPPGYVILDKYGRRYANEWLQAVSKPNFYYELLRYDAARLEYPRIPSYWIFDARRMAARPLTSLTSGIVGSGFYDWSPDNSREVERGWIKRADSVEELAGLAGIADPEQAARTVAEYNRACATGVDELERPADSLIPLDAPPYYCVPVYPGGANTNGGPRRDSGARVLDVRRRPIPGLFAAGELGGTIGLLYPAPGANLSEAFVFGQIAAESALS